MKRLILFCSIIMIMFISCKSTDITDVKENEAAQNQYNNASRRDGDEEEVGIILIEDEEPYIDEEEYKRSTVALSEEESVTPQEFSEDKQEILRIIDELAKIMEEQDVDGWLSYLDPESIKFYSTPANVRKAQKKLPDKTIQLNGIGDYFKYVFIPSRKRSEVDEIRYISKTNIKAVKVKDDNSINVYYYFVKIDGKWLVHIPTI